MPDGIEGSRNSVYSFSIHSQLQSLKYKSPQQIAQGLCIWYVEKSIVKNYIYSPIVFYNPHHVPRR